jgi:hypothetical protein
MGKYPPFDKIVSWDVDYSKEMSWKLKYWGGRFNNEKIYIVGNGSSLDKTPLDKLDSYSFATNRISRIYESTSWRPTHYLCMSHNIQKPDWLADIRETVELKIPSFIWWKWAGLIGDYKNIIWTDYYKDHIWVHDSSIGLMKWGSSGLSMIQLAMYIGFNPIVLVGFDGDWTPFEGEDPNHFGNGYLTKVTDGQANRWNYHHPLAHMMALDAAQHKGVNIIDATIDGKLDVYPKCDIRDIL